MIVREIQKEEVQAAQTFLFQVMKVLFNMDRHLIFHKDVINLLDYYVNHPEMTMIGAFDEEESIKGTIGIKTFIDRFPEIEGRYSDVKVAELARCYIEPGMRRQGIGGMLFESLMTACRLKAFDVIYLHTHRHLPGGIHFWQKKNFKIIHEDQERDIVHMEIWLNESSVKA
ncbi:MAG: GNAT family N-acetyltransferase [Clostridia bacterium]|nr:GNAT family N-acetyltransferase [Clostridia bacterium]